MSYQRREGGWWGVEVDDRLKLQLQQIMNRVATCSLLLFSVRDKFQQKKKNKKKKVQFMLRCYVAPAPSPPQPKLAPRGQESPSSLEPFGSPAAITAAFFLMFLSFFSPSFSFIFFVAIYLHERGGVAQGVSRVSAGCHAGSLSRRSEV